MPDRVTWGRRLRRLRPAPGVVGRVLAVGVSWAALSLGGSYLTVLAEEGIDRDPGFTLWFWATFAGVLALVTVPAGVLLVHLASRPGRRQASQIAASGLAGGLAGFGAALLLHQPPRDWDAVALVVGLCTALVRTVVVPWIPTVRSSFPAGTTWWRRFRLG